MLPHLLDGHPCDRERLDLIVQEMGLTDRRYNLPNQLSGGQQQRVSIGRAIYSHPAIVLADEPTGNLDRKNGEEIIRLLKEANRKQKQTLILITHDESIDWMYAFLVRRRSYSLQTQRTENQEIDSLSFSHSGQNILPPFESYSEGQLGILQSEIYKVMNLLEEQSRQSKEQNTYLADMLSDISHQLKTPLAGITLLTDLLKIQICRSRSALSMLSKLRSRQKKSPGW